MINDSRDEWIPVHIQLPSRYSADPSGYVQVKKGKRIEKRKWNMVANSEFTHWAKPK